ncbi:MAG: hypothetical protein MUO63_02155, partial [Desulfobulbaceae bacterium]|nr:hypothetical protein [Desulfobulbaceae bacterium]
RGPFDDRRIITQFPGPLTAGGIEKSAGRRTGNFNIFRPDRLSDFSLVISGKAPIPGMGCLELVKSRGRKRK